MHRLARRRMAFAQQELRLISTLVLLIGLGLFLALPFVLSIGSVVFLPLTTAIILSILLAPLADKLAGWGMPNVLASLMALLVFFAIVLLAFAVILQPAIALFDELPRLADQVAARFAELRDQFAWLAAANDRFAEAVGYTGTNEVTLAGPSFFEQLAIGAPNVVLKVLLTFLMAFSWSRRVSASAGTCCSAGPVSAPASRQRGLCAKCRTRSPAIFSPFHGSISASASWWRRAHGH